MVETAQLVKGHIRMAEQFEKAVEIGGLFVTAIQFLFTVTGKDQNRGAIIPDMVQGSRFVDCRLQRFQPSLVAGFEMSDYLAAERDDPGKLVGIFLIRANSFLSNPTISTRYPPAEWPAI